MYRPARRSKRLASGLAAPGAFAQSVFAMAPQQRSSLIGLAASGSISRITRSGCRTDQLLPALRRRWPLPIWLNAACASGRPTQCYEKRLSLYGNVAHSPPGPAMKECLRWSSRSFGCPPRTRPTASRARKPSANCARRCRCRARCGSGRADCARTFASLDHITGDTSAGTSSPQPIFGSAQLLEI